MHPPRIPSPLGKGDRRRKAVADEVNMTHTTLTILHNTPLAPGLFRLALLFYLSSTFVNKCFQLVNKHEIAPVWKRKVNLLFYFYVRFV